MSFSTVARWSCQASFECNFKQNYFDDTFVGLVRWNNRFSTAPLACKGVYGSPSNLLLGRNHDLSARAGPHPPHVLRLVENFRYLCMYCRHRLNTIYTKSTTLLPLEMLHCRCSNWVWTSAIRHGPCQDLLSPHPFALPAVLIGILLFSCLRRWGPAAEESNMIVQRRGLFGPPIF